MAYIGVRKPYIVPFKSGSTTLYEDPIFLGKATTFNESPNTSDVKLYGDDAVAESERGVTYAALTIGSTDFPVDCQVAMFGHTEDGTSHVVTANIDDASPYVGFAVIGVKMVGGTKYYEARVYPKTQWTEPNTDLTTRGENTEFQTPSTEGTAYPVANGDWRMVKICESEADAMTYITSCFPKTA